MRVLAAEPADLGEGAARQVGVGVAGAAEPDAVPGPLLGEVALAAAAALGPVGEGVGLDGAALLRVPEPAQQRLVAAVEGPGRQQRLQGRGADRVGDGVAADVDAALPQGVQVGQQAGGGPEHGGPRLHVGHVAGHPGALGHGGDLGHGLGDPLRLVADVAGVDAAEGGDHLAEGDELVQRGVGPGGVGQAAGEADGAVLHGPGGELPHALHLRRRRLAVVPAHGRHPHVPVAHEGGHVGADALVLQAGEVAVEAGPVALEAAGHGRVQGAVVGLVVPGRRRRHAAVADDLGGDPLGHGGGGAALHQEGEVGVGVDVDEAGGDEAPGGIDPGRPPRPRRDGRRRRPGRPGRPRRRRAPGRRCRRGGGLR